MRIILKLLELQENLILKSTHCLMFVRHSSFSQIYDHFLHLEFVNLVCSRITLATRTEIILGILFFHSFFYFFICARTGDMNYCINFIHCSEYILVSLLSLYFIMRFTSFCTMRKLFSELMDIIMDGTHAMLMDGHVPWQHQPFPSTKTHMERKKRRFHYCTT